MNLNAIRGIPLALAAVLLLLPSVSAAQSVAVNNDSLEIFDTDGDLAVILSAGGDYLAGGLGRTATLDLQSLDGPSTFFYHAFQAQLILGGGTHEGILILKDDTGHTTIDLDGRSGTIRLGGTGEDGDVVIFDDDFDETARIDGQTGSLVNSLNGNGLVKAWAKVAFDGSVVACWRCNSGVTTSPEVGVYHVSFSPLASDIRSRPRMATIDSHTTSTQSPAFLTLSNNADSNAAVTVEIDGVLTPDTNRSFTVFIY